MGCWSYRKSKPEFHFHTYQEYGPWRFALRVGSRAEEVEAPSNENAKGDLSGSPFAFSSAGPALLGALATSIVEPPYQMRVNVISVEGHCRRPRLSGTQLR